MRGERLLWTQSTGRIKLLSILWFVSKPKPKSEATEIHSFSLLLGALILCMATGSLLIVHTSPSRQSVQIESKWCNIILVFR